MSPQETSQMPLILTSKDPSFSAGLEQLCQNSAVRLVTTAGPSITLETVRNNAPELVLLDLDSIDAAEAIRLVLKLTLVSRALIVLTGVETVPGEPVLDALIQAGAHGSLLKPEGKTSLSLATENGQVYLNQLIALKNELQRRRVV